VIADAGEKGCDQPYFNKEPQKARTEKKRGSGWRGQVKSNKREAVGGGVAAFNPRQKLERQE